MELVGNAYALALRAASSDGLAGLAVLALLGETCVAVRRLSRGSHEGMYSYQGG